MKEDALRNEPEKKSHFFIVIAVTAALEGILFGYDTGVISGAILFIKKEFNFSAQMNGFVVSSVLIGAFFGAIFSGRLSDHLGRKRLLIIDAVLFGVGSIISALDPEVWTLIGARVLVGIAIGISSYVAPLYISEISPKKYWGALVSLNQLAIVTGIFLSYLIDYFFALHDQWRWMLAVGVIPALFLFIGMLFLPYSLLWIASKGERQKALSILKKIRGKGVKVEREMAQIEKSMLHQKGIWKTLFSSPIRKSLLIGMGLTIIQQVTGINTIIYYAPTIFEMAGFQTSHVAILATMGIGGVNLLFTVIALPLIDLWGRKPLLFIGLIGMCLGLLGLAYTFHYHHQSTTSQWISMAGMILYIACFAASLGPIAWLLIAEVYPLKVRELGCSVTTGTNWAANWLVTFTFLTLVQFLGASFTFFLYFLIGIVSIFFIYFIVPETTGVSLEDIEENLMAGKSPRHLGRK